MKPRVSWRRVGQFAVEQDSAKSAQAEVWIRALSQYMDERCMSRIVAKFVPGHGSVGSVGISFWGQRDAVSTLHWHWPSGVEASLEYYLALHRSECLNAMDRLSAKERWARFKDLTQAYFTVLVMGVDHGSDLEVYFIRKYNAAVHASEALSLCTPGV